MTIFGAQRSQETVLVVFLAPRFRECMEASVWNLCILVDKHLSFACVFNIFIRFRGMDGC